MPKYAQPDAARRSDPTPPAVNLLDLLAPARSGDDKRNLGHAVGAVFAHLNGIAALHGVRKLDTLRPGTWTPPEWDQAAFEAQCYATMTPDAADHLIRHVATARSSQAFAESEAQKAEREARAEARRRTERQDAAHRLLMASDLPADLYDANLDTTQHGTPLTVGDGNRRALWLCSRLVSEWALQHKGLTLSGPDSGCGKTYAAGAVARELIRANVRVQWVTASRLLDLYRKSFGATWEKNPGVPSGEQVWQRYAVRPGLLVLDDLGAEKVATGEAGDWARERLLDLIDHRHDGKKTLLVTTNLDERALRDKYGARIVSRLLGRSPLVTMTGPDFRQSAMPDADDPFAD